MDIKQVENPIELNYTFYGSENYRVKGTWQEMNLKFNKQKQAATTVDDFDYSVNITVFLAYAKPPERGLSGTLGIAVTSVSDKHCVICALNTTYGLPRRYISFSFNHTNDFTKHTG